MNQELALRIILENPPTGVDFGLQKGIGSKYETIQMQRFSDKDLEFEFPISVKLNEDGLPNFLGVFVQGPSNQRFIYIDIGACAGQKDTNWSRRLKISLTGIDLKDKKFTLDTYNLNQKTRKYTIEQLEHLNLKCIPSFSNFVYFSLEKYKKDFF